MRENDDTRAPIVVIDRSTGAPFEEPVLGGGLLHLAYTSPIGPVIRCALLRTGLASRILGWYTGTRSSRRRIRSVIDELGIDETEFAQPTDSFDTFHEFFVRHLRSGARPFDPDPNVLSSPADARMSVIPQVDGDTAIPVKGRPFSLTSLSRGRAVEIEPFVGGLVMVFRLCPADYHRFHYPAAGRTVDRRTISGRYESVNPIALRAGIPIFTENRRVVSFLDLDPFGPALYIEVGAFGVGGITQTHAEPTFEKMDEKGFFHYGASTLVLVFGKNRITVDRDLVEHSASGLEILVCAGESIGIMS